MKLMEWTQNQNQNQMLKILKTLDQELGLSILLTWMSYFRKEKDWMNLIMLFFFKSVDLLIPSQSKKVLIGVTWKNFNDL